ncbi:MAG: hypothetical protein QNJ03_07295 [Dinoroseobacter sp.]|nr:hypothetical protein [Dinoroseobacter sp.]
MAITDRESAVAWLRAQWDQRVQIAFAARAALRTAPALGLADPEALDRLAIPALRATLISGVASTCPTPEVTAEIQETALSATAAAFSAVAPSASQAAALFNTSAAQAADSAPSASSAAFSAAHSAKDSATAAAAADTATTDTSDYSARYLDVDAARSAAYSAAYSACDADAEGLDAGEAGSKAKDVFRRTLWPAEARGHNPPGEPEGLYAAYQRLGAFFESDPDTWGFWHRWLEGMRNGQPMDWELQRQVALIGAEDDFKIWEDGPEAVAEEIALIEANWARSKAQINETLVLNDETLLYSAKTIPAPDPDRLKRHLNRVDDALDDILALGGSNGITESTVEYRIIKRLMAKYSDDPERAAFDLREVSRSIERQIDVGEYADDEPVRILQAASTSAVAAICDMAPEVADRLDIEVSEAAGTLGEDGVLVLEAAWQISAAMLDKNASETTREDEAEILRGEIIDAASDEDLDLTIQRAKAYRASVLRRQISRLGQQLNDWRKISKLAEHYDSDHSRAAGVVMRYGGVATVLAAAINQLARLLGLGV